MFAHTHGAPSERELAAEWLTEGERGRYSGFF